MTPGQLLIAGRPKFRDDIIVTRHEDATNAPFVAKDPRTTQFFRFREAEHFILSQLDGVTPLDVVRQRTEERFGATLPQETLIKFVRTLESHGLLETDKARRGSRSRARLKGGLLSLRFKVFDPDKLLTRMVTPLEPLFSKTFVGLTLTLVWRVTTPESLASSTALIVLATTGFKIVLNLNPLLKLDGYYLLSDLLGVPNLRQRSFDYVGRCFSRLEGTPSEAPVVSRRERRIYLAYGSLAMLYSIGTLWFVAIRLGGLISRFQAWGLLAFLVLFSARLRNRLRRLPFWRPATPPPTPGPDKAAAPARKKRRALVALAILAVASVLVKIDLRVAGEFRVLPTRNAEVRTEVEGLVAEVYVREGMKIQQGDLVARLSDRDLAAEDRKSTRLNSSHRTISY